MTMIADVLRLGLPARRGAPADPRLRAVDPQDRRGRGPALPPVRARAADPPGRRRAGDGRGDGGPGPRPAAADVAADGLHPPALPALLHRAGRRRPHGDRDGARDAWAGCRWPSASSTSPASPATPRRRATRRRSTWSSASSRPSRRRCPSEALIVKTIGDEVMIVSPGPGDADRVVGGLPRPVLRAAPAAGRPPLRPRRLPRRRLLRQRRQPHPPGGRPRARRRGDGHRAPSSTRSASSDYLRFDPIGRVELKGLPEPVELFVGRRRRAPRLEPCDRGCSGDCRSDARRNIAPV